MSRNPQIDLKPSDNIDTNIKKLLVLGRNKFARLFEGTQQNFDSPQWEIGHLTTRSRTGHFFRLYFAARGNKFDLFPPSFANIVKCWLLHKPSSLEYMKTRLDVTKALWAAILIRRENKPWQFTWDSLCEEDLRQAEHLMANEWQLTTSTARSQSLVSFIRFLERHGICRTIYFSPSPSTYRKIRYSTLAGCEARRSKLPTKRALEGLGEIYATHAKSPADRLCSAAIALLVVTGFRIGELLTLPEQCEVEETYNGKARYGLLYHKEKTKGGHLVTDIRWLTPIQGELARAAVTELRSITAFARERAKVLEEHSDTVFIPEFESIPYVTARQITETVGISLDLLYLYFRLNER